MNGVPSKMGVGQTRQLILIRNRFETTRRQCPLHVVPHQPCFCLDSVLILETVKHNMPNWLIEIVLFPVSCRRLSSECLLSCRHEFHGELS